MNSSELFELLANGTLETLYMTLVSTLFAYVIGIPLGILLVMTKKDGLRPNRIINTTLNIVVNVLRSVPFLILLVAVMPITKFVVGTSIGSTATIVPLVIASAPFIARLVESSLLEVDNGVIEAGRSMGASDFTIVRKILIPEAKPSLITGAAIAITTLLGYSAMAGFVGGGGLGDIAIKYGFYRYQNDIMLITVILLVIIVQIIQEVGNHLAKGKDQRQAASWMKKIICAVLVCALGLGVFVAYPAKEKSDKTIVVGASATPHGEILKAIQSLVEEKGYKLEIKEFSDYVLPNTSLSSNELDANFFQHQPYLDGYNEENNTNLVSAAAIHFEPIAVYSNKITDLSKLKEGDIVAVPSDTTNEARALLLLEAHGLIKLKANAGINATAKDIIENPLNLKIKELEAAQIARSLDDVTIGVINGNYALQAGLSVADDALVTEDATSISAKTYANILVVNTGHEETEKTKVLVEALTSDACKEFIQKTYNGSVVPMF